MSPGTNELADPRGYASDGESGLRHDCESVRLPCRQ